MTLQYFVGFNNYFNRKIKYYTSLLDYVNNSVVNFEQTSINFNPNDGVSTEQIVNWEGGNQTPDYVLVIDDNDQIVSRWFVTEWVRTRGGQYNATLKRDVIADHYEKIKLSPFVCERGPISDENSPLVYHPEGGNYNQIKMNQIPLKDETETPWIVGYLAKSFKSTENDILSNPKIEDKIYTFDGLKLHLNNEADPNQGCYLNYPNAMYEEDGSLQTDFRLLLKIINPLQSITGTTLKYNYLVHGYLVDGTSVTSSGQESIWKPAYAVCNKTHTDAKSFCDNVIGPTWARKLLESKNLVNSSCLNLLDMARPDLSSQTNAEIASTEPIVSLVLGGVTKYYKLILETTAYNTTLSFKLGLSHYANLWTTLSSIADETIAEVDNSNFYRDENSYTDTGSLSLQVPIMKKRFRLEEVSIDTHQVKVGLNESRLRTSDSLYDIFCMPYKDDLLNLNLAQKMVETLTTNNIYDLQILPFCPVRFAIDDYNYFKVHKQLSTTTSLREHINYEFIKSASPETLDEIVSIMFWANTASDKFTINQSVMIENRTNNAILNKKISNECDIYRITGPNMASSYEFSVAKNGGVDSFLATYTYKPISPYIRIQPEFKCLYGDNFKDARGLIFNGDFSIDTLTDHWQQYQVQNKNFQEIFNTQVKNQQLALTTSIASTASSQLTGALALGAIASNLSNSLDASNPFIGSVHVADIFNQAPQYAANKRATMFKSMGPLGAIAGMSAANAGIGIGTGIASLNNTKLIHEYELGNIKAQPDTLNKISAYNIDNTYFPVLEYYTATDIEIEFLKRRIQYNNYNLGGIITTLTDLESSFTQDSSKNYVQGSFILLESLNDDTHLANEINNEIFKGVYL